MPLSPEPPPPASRSAASKPEEIAIIGGGLGGCLTALELAQQETTDHKPRYHITLLAGGKRKSPSEKLTPEQQKTKILEGASLTAFRKHNGGEYPLDEETAKDCLHGSILWKMLMPGDIYTDAPPIRFLLAQETQARAERQEKEKQENKKLSDHAPAVTHEAYREAYENVRNEYARICKTIAHAFPSNPPDRLDWDLENTQKNLLGSFQKAEKHEREKQGFYRELNEDEYAAYNQGDTRIAWGFQSQEIGFNVPKSLAMIEKKLRELAAEGRITLIEDCEVQKVTPLKFYGDELPKKRQRFVAGDEKNFRIDYIENQTCKTKKVFAGQVVLAAWQENPKLYPHLGKKTEEDAEGKSEEKENTVTVHKRAMLLIDLPKDKPPPQPVFIIMGKDGGMLSPLNAKVAVCYLPLPEAAYKKGSHDLKDSGPHLPENWNHLSENDRKEWTESYFTLAKQRFYPLLEGADNPRLLVRDTLNFQKALEERREQRVQESAMGMGMSMQPAMTPEMQELMQQEMEMLQALGVEKYFPPEELNSENSEGKPVLGLFAQYNMKATYAVLGAVQTAQMIVARSQSRGKKPSPLGRPAEPELIQPRSFDELLRFPRDLANYSLRNKLNPPSKGEIRKFIEARKDFAGHCESLMDETKWPEQEFSPATQVLVPAVSKGAISPPPPSPPPL